jgi:hypothetical protein
MSLSKYCVKSQILKNTDEIKSDWLELQNKSDCSFFQSWGWVGPWLSHVVIDLKPLVVRVWFGDLLVGLGLFVMRDLRRHFIIRSSALFLNEYPFDGRNMVIEYNGLLAARGHQSIVYTETLRYLLHNRPACDEFYFGAITDVVSLRGLPATISNNIAIVIEREAYTWFVDLSRIDQGMNAYLAGLSQNRRWKIRRIASAIRGKWQITTGRGRKYRRSPDVF